MAFSSAATVSRVLKKPQKRKSGQTKEGKEGKEGKRTIEIARPTSTVSSGPSNGIDRVAKLLEEQKRDLERKEYEKKLNHKIDDEIAEKVSKSQWIAQANKNKKVDTDDPLFIEYYPDVHKAYDEGVMNKRDVKHVIRDELGKGIQKMVDEINAAHKNINNLKRAEQIRKKTEKKVEEERIKKKRDSKINDELNHELYNMSDNQVEKIGKRTWHSDNKG